jgi:hypothetical protein
MQPNHKIDELADELSILIRFYDRNERMLGENAVFNDFREIRRTPDELKAGAVMRIKQLHVIPPFAAAYASIVCIAEPRSSRTERIGIGNVRIWPAPSEDVTDWVVAPTFAMTAAPITGSWTAGDVITNSLPNVGQPKEWVCTVSGSPGGWVSGGNL